MRNREHLKNTFRFSAEYLKLNEQCTKQINFCDYGVQLTRGFRALKLWLSLKAFGLDAFRAAITKGIENAEIVESLLRNDDCWEIITPAQLGIITFRYRADGLDESALNELNNHIAQDIIYSGYAMLSPNILGGKHVLRMCTINPRTTHDDLKQTVGMLKSFGEHIEVKPIS